ncbi:MAG: mevalonate kinase [Halobacteriovoraceae bacterium]|nr:mevalonate kinase [Halobacteriovoraceae bacterium]|tara:strand:+ start:9951 stop:10862 length:912 start_codon:yes stop_codon:yes gene_type:complete
MRSFNGKILLFGEYAIIKGSMGLAFPIEGFAGQLDFTENSQNLSQKLRLDEFYKYLKGSKLLNQTMNLARLKTDIEKGLYFKSNIPQGYGIGSSGALCAGLYAEYALDFEQKTHYENDELMSLKDIMSLMESFYHGTSSGIDCLISLINLPVIIESRSKVKICENPLPKIPGHFYLFDSGKARMTSSFVHDFMEKFEKNTEYREQIMQFVNVTNDIIKKCKVGQNIDESFHQLSRLQYLHMPKMIPQSLKNFWLTGLESRKYYVKLCGAGGGGYFIVYTHDPETQSKFDSDQAFTRIKYGQGL